MDNCLFYLSLLSAATLTPMEVEDCRMKIEIHEAEGEAKMPLGKPAEVTKPDVFEACPEWGPLRLFAEHDLFQARGSYQIAKKEWIEALCRLNQAEVFKRGDLELAKKNYTRCLLAYKRSINDFEKARSVIIRKFGSC